MTESRVEAVARAIAVFVGNDPDARQLGRKDSPLLWELHKSCAQTAIEANDAWLKHKIVCQNCGCENYQDRTECIVCSKSLIVETRQ